MIKLLIGGSPCTYWSIAQKNNRETEPSGMGWELFKNYLIAKEKFKPDFFLYKNNKSTAQAIKDEIKKQFRVWDGTFCMEDTGARYIEINSALVSAQNRQRFYVHNCGDVEQPEDRGILLRDILESGIAEKEKGYCLKHQAGKARDYFKKHHTNIKFEPVIFQYPHGDNPGYIKHDKAPTMTANACYQENNKIIEPINITPDGKAQTLKAQYQKNNENNFCCYSSTYGATGVAEPVCVQEQVFGRKINKNGEYDRRYEARKDSKSGSLTGTNRQNSIAQPVRIGTYPSKAKNTQSKQYRIYDVAGKSTTLCGEGGGIGAKTRLYAIPTHNHVYEVRDGMITIKDKQYPIKLKDGYYIIRKLTVTECCRLQTMPDDYCRAVSNAQAYKGLGNGWTAEVIIHILNGALKDVPRDTPIKVLSMYDGIGIGRYCLDKMGFTNVEYHALEIDKYAMQIAMSNYPDIIQHGDAFQVREEGWTI